jgi:hypothetical protein
VSTPTDGELLRLIGHAALQHLDKLVGEGLRGDAVEKLAAHAVALTARVLDLADQPERSRTHALGMWELLTALAGPVSASLLLWLDEALGSRP